MKSIILAVLIFSVLIGSAVQSLTFVRYTLNKNYYSTVLCENRAKPRLQCEGKCKLAKELKSQEEDSQKPLSPIKEKQNSPQFFESCSTIEIIACQEEKQFVFHYIEFHKQAVFFAIFHPPTT